MNKSDIIFVFPGQGAQSIGMGQDFYNEYSEAKEVFEEVSDALQQDMGHLIFNGDDAELSLTSNTQPAIMTVSVAIARTLLNALGKHSIDECAFAAAGHSLGEYSALCMANSISLHDTAKILRKRGEAMQNAVPVGVGAMSVLLGASISDAHNLIKQLYNEIKNSPQYNPAIDYVCEVANYNSSNQIVLSGHKEMISLTSALAPQHGIKRAIELPVSAPFHCSLMESAANSMRHTLEAITINDPTLKIIHNYDAQYNEDASIITDMLVKQIPNMVQWRNTMHKIQASNTKIIIECGPGNKVLTNLFRREFTDSDIKNYSISSIKELDDLLKMV